MSSKKGISFLEILVVLTIVGILLAVILPNFTTYIEQTNAQTAQNNLMAIAAAQKKYFEDNGNYYASALPNKNDPNINANLSLSLMTNDAFSYNCSTAVLPYQCTAWDGTDTLTLNPNASPSITCADNGNNGKCPANLQ